MMAQNQLALLARKFKTNEFTVLREYLQLLFLNALYSYPGSQHIAFKGGTAIHLIFGAPRFSEDLDFTVQVGFLDFEKLMSKVFASLDPEGFTFKPRKTIAGKRYMLSNTIPGSKQHVFISLDFSFREKVFDMQNSSITTLFPIVFTARVSHMSLTEMYTEKVRAILHRQKGRDLYDLWYLCAKGAKLDTELLQHKLDYYKLSYSKDDVLKKVSGFDRNKFIFDLRPFVTLSERDTMGKLYDYIQMYLKENL